MNSRVDLRLDWCSHQAAAFACEHWHYSRLMPRCKLVKVGVWENGKYIGCVIFSYGANNNLHRPFGLKATQVCELTRVALTAHTSPVTRIIAVAVRMLRGLCPGLRLVVSYADPSRGHLGGIYQAGNWIYDGMSGVGPDEYFIGGRWVHGRVMNLRYGTVRCEVIDKILPGVKRRQPSRKHRYLLPLDADLRAELAGRGRSYPKSDAS
jgi:hypothetical protein